MYLSWSIYMLTIVTVVSSVLLYLILRFSFTELKFRKSIPKEHRKMTFYSFLMLYLLIAFIAIDVGTPQSEFNRSRMNAQFNTDTIERVESGRLTREETEQVFQQRVNQQRQENQ